MARIGNKIQVESMVPGFKYENEDDEGIDGGDGGIDGGNLSNGEDNNIG